MLLTRVLALSQLLGAALLVAGSFYDLEGSGQGMSFRVLLAPLVFAAVSTTAGVLLILREPISLYLTLLVQALQTILIGAPVRWVFAAGLKAATIASPSGVQVQLGIAGEHLLTFAPPDAVPQGSGLVLQFVFGYLWTPLSDAAWSIGINWVPLLLAWYLWKDCDNIVAGWDRERTGTSVGAA